ncbi:MAG: tRNA adenosine(34) deaminase TadA [Sphaerochaetaceae bacterium]|nr:tRNA adenosine(34) deaminase TadA [Sphaerochaetaceae bacterium]
MNPSIKSNEYFMAEALKEAKKAYDKNEVPVGCVIVKDNEVVARAHNLRETKQNPLAHAEILAIELAAKKLNNWRLDDCEIFVTLEPCIMCSGAVLNTRMKKLIYGAKEPKFGAHQSLTNVYSLKANHKVEIISGILEEESNKLLKKFFQKLRSEKN